MVVPERPAERDDSASVDRGGDAVDARPLIAELTREVATLQRRLASAEAAVPARSTDGAIHLPAAAVAEAEHQADQVRSRAFADAKRLRSRGWEEGRDTGLQARRDALTLVKQARKDADQIMTSAREQVAALHERARKLQEVVGRTEVLLRELASGDLGSPKSAVTSQEQEDEVGVEAVAAEQSRGGRMLHGTPDPGLEGIPDSVQRLLSALRAGGPSGQPESR